MHAGATFWVFPSFFNVAGCVNLSYHLHSYMLSNLILGYLVFIPAHDFVEGSLIKRI